MQLTMAEAKTRPRQVYLQSQSFATMGYCLSEEKNESRLGPAAQQADPHGFLSGSYWGYFSIWCGLRRNGVVAGVTGLAKSHIISWLGNDVEQS
jgi:hypothetical protein